MGRRRSEKTDTQWLENWSEEELLFVDTILDNLDSIKSLSEQVVSSLSLEQKNLDFEMK